MFERCLLEEHDDDSMAALRRLNPMQWGAVSVLNTLTSPPTANLPKLAVALEHTAHNSDGL